jgi:hypothetical protein
MFESIIRTVLAHKQIIIAVVAFAGLVGYLSPLPNAIAQNFLGIPTNLSVSTPNTYERVVDNNLSVSAGPPGPNQVNLAFHWGF